MRKHWWDGGAKRFPMEDHTPEVRGAGWDPRWASCLEWLPHFGGGMEHVAGVGRALWRAWVSTCTPWSPPSHSTNATTSLQNWLYSSSDTKGCTPSESLATELSLSNNAGPSPRMAEMHLILLTGSLQGLNTCHLTDCLFYSQRWHLGPRRKYRARNQSAPPSTWALTWTIALSIRHFVGWMSDIFCPTSHLA